MKERAPLERDSGGSIRTEPGRLNRLELEEVVEKLARSDAALRDSEERFRALYDNIPLMYFTLESDGTVLSVNTMGAEELGYTADELVGRPVLRVFHPEDREQVARQLANALEHPRQVQRWEFRKIRKDGSELWVHETVRAVVGLDGRVIVLVVCEDVTERKLIRKQLMEHERRLEELTLELARSEERERRRISIGLHDDIGQTLAMAGARIGQIEKKASSADAAELANVRAMIEQMIDKTRSLTFELSSPVLYELGLEAALHDLCDRMSEAGAIRFCFETDERPKRLPEETSVFLFRIVRELARNVVRHSQAANAVIAVSSDAEKLRVRVEDDGKGFDLEAVEGEHLGLFNVREQLRHIGGRLDMKSTPREGTRVTVVVPVEAGGPESGA